MNKVGDHVVMTDDRPDREYLTISKEVGGKTIKTKIYAKDPLHADWTKALQYLKNYFELDTDFVIDKLPKHIYDLYDVETANRELYSAAQKVELVDGSIVRIHGVSEYSERFKGNWKSYAIAYSVIDQEGNQFNVGADQIIGYEGSDIEMLKNERTALAARVLDTGHYLDKMIATASDWVGLSHDDGVARITKNIFDWANDFVRVPAIAWTKFPSNVPVLGKLIKAFTTMVQVGYIQELGIAERMLHKSIKLEGTASKEVMLREANKLAKVLQKGLKPLTKEQRDRISFHEQHPNPNLTKEAIIEDVHNLNKKGDIENVREAMKAVADARSLLKTLSLQLYQTGAISREVYMRWEGHRLTREYLKDHQYRNSLVTRAQHWWNMGATSSGGRGTLKGRGIAVEVKSGDLIKDGLPDDWFEVTDKTVRLKQSYQGRDVLQIYRRDGKKKTDVIYRPVEFAEGEEFVDMLEDGFEFEQFEVRVPRLRAGKSGQAETLLCGWWCGR